MDTTGNIVACCMVLLCSTIGIVRAKEWCTSTYYCEDGAYCCGGGYSCCTYDYSYTSTSISTSVIGGIVSIVIFVIIIVAVTICCCRRRRNLAGTVVHHPAMSPGGIVAVTSSNQASMGGMNLMERGVHQQPPAYVGHYPPAPAQAPIYPQSSKQTHVANYPPMSVHSPVQYQAQPPRHAEPPRQASKKKSSMLPKGLTKPLKKFAKGELKDAVKDGFSDVMGGGGEYVGSADFSGDFSGGDFSGGDFLGELNFAGEFEEQ